ncbi:CRTAC1 family protein [Schlesneria sp. T3-172]|uniref:CRTAC1 family protein n=1 Tax=Schlesneria TaxID=656899 RepID=UPI002EEE250B
MRFDKQSVLPLLATLCVIFLSSCQQNSEIPEAPLSQSEPTPASLSAPITFVEKPDFFAKPFSYDNGENSEYFAIIEAIGGGLATLDYDRDGMFDLIIAGGGELLPENQIKPKPTGFYRNIGNWKGVDLTHLFPPAAFFSHGAYAADFDNDGFCDVIITGYGGVQLLHNTGDGHFQDVTRQSELIDDSWSTAAAWGDFNGDGVLDLYVAHYANWSFENNPVCLERPSNLRDTCAPRNFVSLDDSAFLGTGDGRFRSAHSDLGFSPGGKGLGVLSIDLDGDLDLDLYVANDGEPNFVYQNNGGTFSDVSIVSGADRNERGLPDGSMGLEGNDFNGDMLPDLWVTNFEKESMALYRAMPGSYFQHVSQPLGITGIGSEYVGWGICLRDFDGDGDEDVCIATGHANRHSPTSPRFQVPILLENQDGRLFSSVAAKAGSYFTTGHLGRGLSACDLDNDGRIDLAVSQILAPTVVLENTTPHTSRWIGLQLVGRTTSRDPIGTRIVLRYDSARQTRFITSGASYLSTSDSRVLFHVPEAAENVSIEITWPSGQVQILSSPQFSQYSVIVEPPSDEVAALEKRG